MHIGLTQQTGKSVFVGLNKCCHCEPVRTLAWQSPGQRENVPKSTEGWESPVIFGGNRYLIPFNRGIATTSVRTGLAMTGNLESARQTPIYRTAE